VIVGVCRTYGGVVGGERSEWIKPIMFSAGVGWIHDEHLKKQAASPGMLVAKVRLGENPNPKTKTVQTRVVGRRPGVPDRHGRRRRFFARLDGGGRGFGL
jgi:hypothetical protein